MNNQTFVLPTDSLIETGKEKHCLAYLLAILSGVLLSLPYNYPQLFVLTWVAFVPLLYAIHLGTPGKAYWLGMLMGITFYLMAASWIVDFVTLFKDYKPLRSWIISIIFWLYCAQLPALLMLTLRWLSLRLQLNALLLFPVLAVLFYRFFPMLFSVQLGESQSRFLSAIQAAEFTGIYGLDFLIALVNCLVLAALLPKTLLRSKLSRAVCYFAAALIPAWFAYGIYSTSYWDNHVANWETTKIGFVQPDETPSAAVPPSAPGFSYGHPPEMAISALLAKSQPDIIVWPETRFKGFYYHPYVAAAFARQVSEFSVPIIFQDVERINQNEDNIHQETLYNSATFLNPQGEAVDVYRKTKRVAFGEYLPIFDESPTAKGFVKKYFGDFFIDFSAGNEPKTFSTEYLKLVPLLCYEVMFPEYVANALNGSASGKILLGLSNNGWFGETRQPYQHLNSSILRTVENRLPMLHVVNNGPSGVILPNGRLILQTHYHEATAMLINMPNSPKSGGSFFSAHPYTFLIFCVFILSVLIIYGVARHRKNVST